MAYIGFEDFRTQSQNSVKRRGAKTLLGFFSDREKSHPKEGNK